MGAQGVGAAVHAAVEWEAMFASGPRGDVFERWLAAHDLPVSEWKAKMTNVYRSHAPIIQAYGDVRPLLDRLQAKVKLGLLTEGRRAAQARKLEALGLGDYFQAIVILDTDEGEAWKPSAIPFQRLLERLEVEGAAAAYVGDNPAKDFRGARELGLKAVRVRRPDGLHAGLEPASPQDAPDLEVNNLADLDRRLGLE
jgi:putative hydrolase of the HAD superfamily